MTDARERRPGGGAEGSHGLAASRMPDPWWTAWILVIVALVVAAALATALGLPDPARQLAVVPFALLAPGMAVARLRRLKSRLAEIALGVLLSVSFFALVASVLLSLGIWDPALAVLILAVGTVVALELDPRAPSRVVVWREAWSAAWSAARSRARARAGARAKAGARPAAPSMTPPAAPPPEQGAAPPPERGAAPPAMPPAEPPAAPPPERDADPLPMPPVAVVRQILRPDPATVQPAKSRGKRQALGEDPLETPAISRQLRSTIDGLIDDLASHKDAPS